MTKNIWKAPDDKKCLQESNIEQWTEIYGKSLTGQVREAMESYKVQFSL